MKWLYDTFTQGEKDSSTIDISNSPNGTIVEAPNQQKTFMDSPAFIKGKGIVKIAIGGLILLNPPYALMIGGTIASGAIAGKIYQNVKGRSFTQMWTDMGDGTFTKNLKDALGMGAGATIGLLAPYVGVALASVGALSFLAQHPEGVDGIFKGGAIATAVGTVGLPLVAGAFLVEGLANSLGYDPKIIGKSFEFVRGIGKSVGKVISVAERSPNAPEKALNVAAKDTIEGAKSLAPAAMVAANTLKNEAAKVKETVDKAPKAQEVASWGSRFTSMLSSGSKAQAIDDQRNSAQTNERSKNS
jgi:hypothetical protein